MFDGLRLALMRRLETLTAASTTTIQPSFDSDQSERLRAQGNSLIAEEKFVAAEMCFREALAHTANDTKLLICLGYVLKEQARFAEARIPLRRAANLGSGDPEAHEAHYLLAEISELQLDLEDAKRHLTSALTLKPDLTRACSDLIRLMRKTGQESAVRELLVRSVNLCPDCLDYRLWLGEVCALALDYQATVDQLDAAIRLGGDSVRINLTIGASLCRLDRYRDPQPYFDRAQELDPTVAFEIFYHQGYFQARSGNVLEAVALFEKSIELRPDCIAAHHMLLFHLCSERPQIQGKYRDAALRFNQAVRPPKQLPFICPSQPNDSTRRVLRVGLLCGEFRNHPVYFFLTGVLAHIDRSKFELVAYSNNEVDDDFTQILKRQMDDWHVIRGMPDDAAAEVIRSHQIDVLIDLCGHSGEGRLPVFARRAAPVQVTWIGYFASTGLDEMDFIVADSVSVPEDSAEWFSEKVIRLPATRLCMDLPKPSREIRVALPPCTKKGYVTFGSFQQAVKISPDVLKVWAQVMDGIPNSRLRIQSSSLGSAVVCDRVAAAMRAAGIDLKRVEMKGSTSFEEYLEAHGEIDMLIDTFPYTGGTTTAFALWMGVPTISIFGDTMLSRQGATMLQCVGLSDWIAINEVDYVDKAVRFSADIPYLIQLRASLREIAEKSALFDTEIFTRNFEKALADMYAQRVVHDQNVGV